MLPEEIIVAVEVGRALESLGIRAVLAGALASAMPGDPRSTTDFAIVAELAESQVEALAQKLGPDFEVDTEALREAARRRGSWNLYHLPSALKVDLFVVQTGPFD